MTALELTCFHYLESKEQAQKHQVTSLTFTEPESESQDSDQACLLQSPYPSHGLPFQTFIISMLTFTLKQIVACLVNVTQVVPKIQALLTFSPNKSQVSLEESVDRHRCSDICRPEAQTKSRA